ncbi:MAG: tetratricopeptide repeat protein [Pseudomonadota bacterium]
MSFGKHRAIPAIVVSVSMLLGVSCRDKASSGRQPGETAAEGKGEAGAGEGIKGGPFLSAAGELGKDDRPGGASAKAKSGPEAAPEEGEEGSGAQAVALPIGMAFPRTKPLKAAPANYRQGQMAFKKDDMETAAQYLDKALDLDPYYDYALQLRARIHAQEGETGQAAKLMERLVAMNYIRFAPVVSKSSWFKAVRKEGEVWEKFEQTMEAYRKVWVDALTGPGQFYIQSHYAKIEGQTDMAGEEIDLRFTRGSVIFWSKNARRFLTLGDFTDVAGYLMDRERNKLTLLRWRPHEEKKPGMMGRIIVSRIDLAEAAVEAVSIDLAKEAEAVRMAIGGKGEVFFEIVGVGEEEEAGEPAGPAEESPTGEEEKAASGEEEKEADEEEPEEEDDDDDEDEKKEPGVPASSIDWDEKKVIEGEMDADQEWTHVVTLGGTGAPPPKSVPEATQQPPKAKRGGACAWIDGESAFCFEPTKKGGTWHDLYLQAGESGPVKLTEEWIPIVQY